MKKVFITGVAEQTGRFDNPIYLATQADLENNQNEHYPIFNVMENAIKEGDDVELVAIKFPNESLERNFFILNDRVKRFEQEHSIEIKTIPIDHKGETKKAHTELFLELIEKIDDSCEIYADITYGTKPTPMIIFALLTFIDSIRINSDVRQVVYGKIVWRPRIEGQASEIESAHIFDVTQLLNIIAITESLRALDGSNIEEAIKLLFSLEGGE